MALSKMNRSKGCFFQCGDTCTEYDDDYISDITKHAPKRWKKFEDQALLQRGLDKLGQTYDTGDWKKGSSGHILTR